MVVRVGDLEWGAWAGLVVPFPSRSGLVCHHGWFCGSGWARPAGDSYLPLSECIPPPTMRAATLSHLIPVAGCICRAAGGCRWADDSVKLRSLAAAGSTSVGGALRPGAASARIRAHAAACRRHPTNATTPTPVRAQGGGASYNGSASNSYLTNISKWFFGVCRVHGVLWIFRGLEGTKCN